MHTKQKIRPVGLSMVEAKSEFGIYLRKRRLELGLSQDILDKLSKLPKNTVTKIEGGQRKYLSSRQLKKLAKVLKLDVEKLEKVMPEKFNVKTTTKLGKMVRARRKKLGLTLERFAKKMGMTVKKARYLETTQNEGISYGNVAIFAKVLDLKLSVFSEFLGRKGKIPVNILGGIVRTRRKEMGIRIIDFAKRLGVSGQRVCQIESAPARHKYDDRTIKRLAEILKLDENILRAARYVKNKVK